MADRRNGTHELAVDCIYTALMQLMETMPYKDISVTDITQKAGVSRMAYYRNYNDKDEILTRHLREHLERFVSQVDNTPHLDEPKFWASFFTTFRDDPVVQNIFKAGLIDKLIEAHRDMMVHVYGVRFGWDLTDERNVIAVYQRMGSMTGLMFYLIERGEKTDIDLLVRQVMADTQGDKEAPQ